MKKYVVIDTNVLVSALITRNENAVISSQLCNKPEDLPDKNFILFIMRNPCIARF